MANEVIKQDLKIINISDKSQYNETDEETTVIRKVTLKNKSKTIAITITEDLDEHILKGLDRKNDVNLEASFTLKIGDPFQKKII